MDKWLAPVYRKFCVNDIYTDCRIIVDNTTFSCHKLILAGASEFFERMFFGEFKESEIGEVRLEDATQDIFEKFRLYVYTYDKSELEKYKNNTIMELLKCGSRWLVPSIIADCSEILKARMESLNIDDLIIYFEFFHTLMIEPLINKVSTVLQNRGKAMKCEKVLELSSDVFVEYVSMSAGVLSETERFQMVESYIMVKGFYEYVKKSRNVVDITTEYVQNADDENNGNIAKAEQKSNEQLQEKTKARMLQYVKDLIGSIEYEKMSMKEFINSAGKSDLLNLQEKYEFLCKICCNDIKYNCRY